MYKYIFRVYNYLVSKIEKHHQFCTPEHTHLWAQCHQKEHIPVVGRTVEREGTWPWGAGKGRNVRPLLRELG